MPKSLVVLCDGTWQSADREYPTNVRLFYNALRKRDPDGALQLAYYQDGVGTDGLLDKLLGGGFGVGLSDNVKEAYRFVVDNFAPGDRLFLLGFSRGAYTARSLAGFIGYAGILKREAYRTDPSFFVDLVTTDRAEAIDALYDLYKIGDDRPDIADTRFADEVHRETPVEFLGVWDTVGALGIPVLNPDAPVNRLYQFHDVTLGGHIKRAYHAVSIDERRGTFRATLWKKRDDAPDDQVVEQVWFAGDHGGVGGGNFVDGLSNIAFQWMCEKAMACGLTLNTASDTPDGIGHPDRQGYILDPAGDGLHGFFARLPQYARDVMYPGYAGQSVHPLVDKKIQEDPTYEPENYTPSAP
ncbi:DUF2235 domain-containing protein [uncultured Rhodospira sp.]|uniref:DUF2235 domain-containing protein n=1 Tax=uncultured Rhodospira sp. TaxID=1936189 RepID=UPI0026372D91|nr:DUF2235 domain-containing protein [uncultured Rhodospira sp.]